MEETLVNSEKKERREAQLAKKAEAIKAYASKVVMTDKTHLTIDGRPYELLVNFHEGFDLEKLEERFSDILTKYDYIVGDMGFDQLRLHGFYKNGSKKGLPSQNITRLQDYLFEYCNFGCPYFVLRNLEVQKQQPSSALDKELYGNERPNKGHKTTTVSKNRKHRQRKRKPKNTPYITEKTYAVHSRKKKQPTRTKRENKHANKRHFVIRQK